MWDNTQVVNLLQQINNQLSTLNQNFSAFVSAFPGQLLPLSGGLTRIFVVLFCFMLTFIFVRFVTPRWL